MKNLMDKYLVERRDRREIDGGDYLNEARKATTGTEDLHIYKK